MFKKALLTGKETCLNNYRLIIKVNNYGIILACWVDVGDWVGGAVGVGAVPWGLLG